MDVFPVQNGLNLCTETHCIYVPEFSVFSNLMPFLVRYQPDTLKYNVFQILPHFWVVPTKM